MQLKNDPSMNYNPQELVLWVDDSLLLINKPSGLLSLPDGYNSELPHLRSVLEPAYGRLWIVHRLDRDTSGVLLLARSKGVHRQLNHQFAARGVKKAYHALVHGVPDWEHITTRSPLKINADRRHRTLIDHQSGVPATTTFHLITKFSDFSLLEACPHTGRTHQIRIHLASLGHPIVADALYGGGEVLHPFQNQAGGHTPARCERPLLERMGLHARSLAFEHPSTGSQQNITAPYPDDFQNTLYVLEQHVP
jgi:RluA family pseudouridine synthase